MTPPLPPAEGFYLPIDFVQVVFDPTDAVPGGIVRSSYRLLEELQAVAPVLGIRLDAGALSDDEAEAVNGTYLSEQELNVEKIT